MRTRDYITNALIDEVANGLKKAVESLTTTDATCYRIILQDPDTGMEDEDLAIFVGWEDGYDADDDNLYITGARKPSPDSQLTIGFALCCGVKVRCDAMWCDYDYLDFPRYKEDGDLPWCGESTIAKDDNYKALAKDLLTAYCALKNGIKKGEIEL